MANEKTYGAKYDSALSTTEIAARIRGEIKEAVKTGALAKGLKVSVRSEHFSGGSAIRVTVTAVPAGFRVSNPEWLAFQAENPHSCPPRDLFRETAEARSVLALLDSMADAYNYDHSDAQTDYFSVNFYGGDAKFDWQISKVEAEQDALVARAASTEIDPIDADVLASDEAASLGEEIIAARESGWQEPAEWYLTGGC